MVELSFNFLKTRVLIEIIYKAPKKATPYWETWLLAGFAFLWEICSADLHYKCKLVTYNGIYGEMKIIKCFGERGTPL